MEKVLKLKRVWALFILALLFSLPLFSTLFLALNPEKPVFDHLWETVLPGYIQNTFFLMLGVGFGSLLLGLTTAALVSFFNFPGKVFIKNF